MPFLKYGLKEDFRGMLVGVCIGFFWCCVFACLWGVFIWAVNCGEVETEHIVGGEVGVNCTPCPICECDLCEDE